MKPMLLAALAVAGTTLAGCAGLTPPSADDVAKLPVVRYGETAPAGDYVLHYPAGAPLPVMASVQGSLLAKPAQARLEVATNRDVYVYKDWVSFDRQVWQAGNQAVGAEFEVQVPGFRDSKAPGTLSARFDLKP